MSGEEADDAVLVTRCLGGDGRAWTLLVERYGPVVWAIARRADLTPDDEADVFQNTWRVAVEELTTLRDRAAFAGWIAQVTRHQAMRLRRGYGIARRSLAHAAREGVDERRPEESLLELEARREVGAAVERIGRRCAELLRALYYEEPPPAYTQIAARLGMRIGSIGPTRARCLEKLQKELGDGAAA
jgi:RNA polymerase sigma factor (sigma-70 family)